MPSQQPRLEFIKAGLVWIYAPSLAILANRAKNWIEPVLVDLILKTIEPALNPFAGTVIGSFGIVTLAGYFVLGYLFSNTLWQALRNGFLLGVVIFILAVAAGDLFSIQLGELAMWFGLHQLAAVFLTASANVSRKWYDFT